MQPIPLLRNFVLLQDFETLNHLAGEIALRHQRSIALCDVPAYPRLQEILEALNLEAQAAKAKQQGG